MSTLSLMAADMQGVTISLASPEDFPAILSLQGKNLRDALSPEERADGFLTVEFTESMLQEVIEDLGIVKAVADGQLVGYRMAQTLEFNRRFPLLVAIMEQFPAMTFSGIALSEQRAFISGPVCIAREWRGRGVHEAMFQKMCAVVRGRFDVGVTFISEMNERSLEAARRKIGMTRVGSIDFEGKHFAILAYAVA